MIGGENFACGSSREAAVWALKAFGIRCVIAPSFGSIFFSNCFQNGVLPVIVPAKVVEELAAEVEQTQGQGKVSIDLKRCVVVSPSGKETPFTIDAMLREGMLEGLDQIELTRAREPQIADFQAKDRAARPWLYPAAPGLMDRRLGRAYSDDPTHLIACTHCVADAPRKQPAPRQTQRNNDIRLAARGAREVAASRERGQWRPLSDASK